MCKEQAIENVRLNVRLIIRFFVRFLSEVFLCLFSCLFLMGFLLFCYFFGFFLEIRENWVMSSVFFLFLDRTTNVRALHSVHRDIDLLHVNLFHIYATRV